MTRIVVDNRIRIPLAGLSRDRVDGLTGAFRHANPTRKPGSDDPEFFESWSQEGDELTIPRGGLARVLELEPGFQIDDQTVWSHPEPSIPNHLVAWRPYQRLMIAAAVRARTCLLRAPTGSGKTTGGFGLISVLKHRSLVMVWTGNLEKQWRERCASELGIDEARVGRIRGSRDDHAPVTVAMQQTVVSRLRRGDRELSHAYDLLLCDEVQRFAAPTLFASVDPFAARYRVGISADESRRDGKEFLTRDLFGDVAHAVEERSLIDTGAVVEVEDLVIPTEFEARWYRYRQDFNRLLSQMCGDERRNELVLDVAARMVRQGHQVLIFTHRVEHARQLDARLTALGIRSGTLLGGVDNEVAFERTKAGLRDGSRRVGIGTYQAIAQGLDLPTVSRGIAATPIANNRQQLGQVRGRLCRASGGKSEGKLALLWDRAIYGRRMLENLVKWHRVVRVLHRGGWVDGRTYLEEWKR